MTSAEYFGIPLTPEGKPDPNSPEFKKAVSQLVEEWEKDPDIMRLFNEDSLSE